MLDLVYKTVTTIVNKETDGFISPMEINLLANQGQMDIFESYFLDENKDKNRENKGLTNVGYANMDYNVRNKITQFAKSAQLTPIDDTVGVFNTFSLPQDLYIIEDDGISIVLPQKYAGNIIEEVERSEIGYMLKSESRPKLTYPIYESMGKTLKIYPGSVEKIDIRYLRTPKVPNWTYQVVTSDSGNQSELFNPSNPSFQDLELHRSEFSNLVMKILLYLGINLNKYEISEVVRALGQEKFIKENN